jgi:hypothetical protein
LRVLVLAVVPGMPRSTPIYLAEERRSKPYVMLLLILLVILVLAVAPAWPYSRGWGYYPSGGLGTILVIVLILMLLGMIHL